MKILEIKYDISILESKSNRLNITMMKKERDEVDRFYATKLDKNLILNNKLVAVRKVSE